MEGRKHGFEKAFRSRLEPDSAVHWSGVAADLCVHGGDDLQFWHTGPCYLCRLYSFFAACQTRRALAGGEGSFLTHEIVFSSAALWGSGFFSRLTGIFVFDIARIWGNASAREPVPIPEAPSEAKY